MKRMERQSQRKENSFKNKFTKSTVRIFIFALILVIIFLLVGYFGMTRQGALFDKINDENYKLVYVLDNGAVSAIQKAEDFEKDNNEQYKLVTEVGKDIIELSKNTDLSKKESEIVKLNKKITKYTGLAYKINYKLYKLDSHELAEVYAFETNRLSDLTLSMIYKLTLCFEDDTKENRASFDEIKDMYLESITNVEGIRTGFLTNSGWDLSDDGKLVAPSDTDIVN